MIRPNAVDEEAVADGLQAVLTTNTIAQGDELRTVKFDHFPRIHNDQVIRRFSAIDQLEIGRASCRERV